MNKAGNIPNNAIFRILLSLIISTSNFIFRSQEKESIVKKMTQEIEEYKNQLQAVNSELKTQRAKNDVSK